MDNHMKKIMNVKGSNLGNFVSIYIYCFTSNSYIYRERDIQEN